MIRNDLLKKFNDELAAKLRTPYTPPNIGGGHDFTHVERMVKMGPRIREILEFDMNEFVTAVWLHNLDRAESLRPDVQKLGGLDCYCRFLLVDSSYNLEQKERIIDAVLQHSKKDDEPNDSTLLTALRIADKLDRFSILTFISVGAFRGRDLLPYDPEQPFGYASTAEDKLKTLYNDLFRVLEWYGMLPSDEARSLVNMPRLRLYIFGIRALGEEIAEATGTENRVEDDIKKALGRYYHRVLNIETSPEILDEHTRLSR